MKKVFSVFLFMVFIFAMAGCTFSATTVEKSETKVITKKITKPAPKKIKKSTKSVSKEPVKATPTPEAVKAAPAPQPVVKAESGYFAEGGIGGGGLVVSLGYHKYFRDKVDFKAAIGYGIGNQYGVVVLDFARVTYDIGKYFLGGGLSYAMYSDIVTNIPGITGAFSNKNLLGVELMGGARFDKITAKLGYNSALGIRASVGYDFQKF